MFSGTLFLFHKFSTGNEKTKNEHLNFSCNWFTNRFRPKIEKTWNFNEQFCCCMYFMV